MRPFIAGAAASAAKRRCARDEAVAATTLTAATCFTAEWREIEVFIVLVLSRIHRSCAAASNCKSLLSEIDIQRRQAPRVLVVSGFEQRGRALFADESASGQHL